MHVQSLTANNEQRSSEGSQAAERFPKQSNRSRYLYHQLSHIERDLRLVGSSSFHSPHSYSHALQQVKDMKSLLEDHTSRFSHVDLAEPTHQQ